MSPRPYDMQLAGKRLLPAIIDERARQEPDTVWASLPYDDADLAQGYEDITYAVYANAINKLAWFIVKKIGRSKTFETITYFGAPDIRYHVIQMAVCKTGHKVLFSSHLNSVAMHLHLFERTQCTTVFSGVGIFVDDLLAASPKKLAHYVVPDLDDLLDYKDRAPWFPYEKTYEEAKWDPYMILHTSGTTGQPKPVVFNHEMAATHDRHCLLDDVDGREHELNETRPGIGVRLLVCTSSYHMMSAYGAMINSIFGRSVFIPGYRHRVPTNSEIGDIILRSGAEIALLTPWMMEEIARKPDPERYVKPLRWIGTTGAVLSSFAWNIWSKYTLVQEQWGSTEGGSVPYFKATNDDLGWNLFDTVAGGLDMRKVDLEYQEDGKQIPVYELFIVFTRESAPFSLWHASKEITLDSGPPYPEYAIGDMFTPHPDPKKASYAWRFIGRTDDIITLSTGVNVHPGPMERALATNRLVRSSMLVGNMHLQPLALVELAEGVTPEQAKDLWEETIKPANSKVAVHAQITDTHVILLPTGSFLRSSKGSVLRKKTEQKFADKIKEAYDKYGDQWQEAKVRLSSISREVEIKVDITNEDSSSAATQEHEAPA